MSSQKDLEVFSFPATDAPLRVVQIGGEPWFVARDVCSALGLGNPRSSVALLDDDEKGVHTVDTLGGDQEVGVITEAGLYALILRSRRPEAKAFKRWITHDVIPSIRRTGRYESTSRPHELTRLEVLEMAIESERRALALAARNAELEPKAEAFDVFQSSDGYFSFEQVAKMLLEQTGLGRNLLIKRLREVGVLTRENLPYQRFAHYFHVVASTFEGTDGRRHTTYTTKVCADGVDFIRRKVVGTDNLLALL